jgi:hypothetical protein
VSDHHNGFVFRAGMNQLAELLEGGGGAECVTDLEFGSEVNIVPDQGCGLHRTLQRASDDLVDLHIESRE